jgi:hypothetical protein
MLGHSAVTTGLLIACEFSLTNTWNMHQQQQQQCNRARPRERSLLIVLQQVTD